MFVNDIKTYWTYIHTNEGICVELPLENPSRELILKYPQQRNFNTRNNTLHA